MKQSFLKTVVVLLAIAAATIGPARGQNSFDVTFSGFGNDQLNIMYEDQSLPLQLTFDAIDISEMFGGGQVNYANVGNGPGQQAIVVTHTTGSVTVTINSAFEGTATIYVGGWDEQEIDYETDIYVSCVYVPVPHTARMAAGTEEAANWSLSSGNASVPGTQVLENVMSGSELTATYSGTRKVKSLKAVKYVVPMESVPLTIEALTDGTIKVTAPKSGMKYSLNGGEKIALTVTVFIDVNAGDKVALYGTATSYNGTRTNGGTAEVKVYGNIMSLINEENYPTATELTAINTFANLFKDNSALTDASGLVLPATTLTTGCYQGLFQNCTSLTQAPAKLPATALANSCYKNMFRNTGLVTVPADLMTDAVVMARESCVSMFRESANLTTAPAITVTTMAAQSCNAMFYHCTSLTSVSALPAATLADSCYYNMFNGCTSLTTVPSDMLPATTVYKSCYEIMFKGTGLTAAPELPATTLVNSCYKSMFHSCSSLSSMTCLATSDLNADYCTEDWVNGAGTNATGTKVFTAYGNWVNWPTGNSGIPTGWTRHDLVEVW